MDKNMKHKHYDAIIAWANGAQIEQQYENGWMLIDQPQWRDYFEYRIKPAKPCPERMETYLNGVLIRSREHGQFAIVVKKDILMALQPKEET